MSHPSDEVITTKMESKESRNPSDRTPQRDTPTWNGLPGRPRKVIRLSIYLYIAAHNRLSQAQRDYIANFQSRMNLAEVSSAMKFLQSLTTDPRTRARLHVDRVTVPYQRTRPKILPEQRRIGVGYRDKGSLSKRSRPSWEKDNTLEGGYYTTAEETRSWDYTILFDPDLGDGNEADEVKSERLKNRLLGQASDQKQLRLTQTEERTWIISQ